MSIAVVNEVYKEARRLAIAGSGLAKDDFRLKKLVAPLEKAGKKAPVFTKVAEAINNVVQSDSTSAPQTLLELCTLVTAILYTQGETGTSGKLKAIKTSGLSIPTSDSSARVLKPLIEALTTTGSGRVEVIRDAMSRDAFRDLRLVKPVIAAIDDPYPEIAELVTRKLLPQYGKAILPELRASFNVKGKGGHVRRLRLMHQLDPSGTQKSVEAALEAGSKEMKVAAIDCLKGSAEHLSYVLEQTKARVKDVRAAAYRALAHSQEDEVIDALIKGLKSSDLSAVASSVRENDNARLLKFLLEEADKQLTALFALKDKAKLSKALDRFHELLGAFADRKDKGTVTFLGACFEQRDAIAKLKGSSHDGGSITEVISSLIARSHVKALQKKLVDAHATLSVNELSWAMIAAMRSQKPLEVFETFSPYYTAKIEKKRGRNPAQEKREVVREVVSQAAGEEMHLAYEDEYDQRDMDLDDAQDAFKGIKLDPAWLDAAVEQDDLSMVRLLAAPKHQAAAQYLVDTLKKILAKSGDQDYQAAEVVDAMVRMKHSETVDSFLLALEKLGKQKRRYYYAWWLVRLIPDLPKSAVPKIEAMLPELNERTIDEVLPYLEALKAK